MDNFFVKVISGRSFDSEPSLEIRLKSSTILINTPPNVSKNFPLFKIQPFHFSYICETSTEPQYMDGIYLSLAVNHNIIFDKVPLLGPENLKQMIFTNNNTFKEPINPIQIPEARKQYFSIHTIQTGKTTSFLIDLTTPFLFNSNILNSHGILIKNWLKELKSRNPIKCPDGTILEPNQYILNDSVQIHIIVIHIQSLTDLSSLSSIDFTKFDAIFHITPESILQQPSYYNLFSNAKRNYFFPMTESFTFIESTKRYIQTASILGLPLLYKGASSNLTVPHFIPLKIGDKLTFPLFEFKSEIDQSLYPGGTDFPLPSTSSLAFTAFGSQSSKPDQYHNTSSYMISGSTGKHIILDPGVGMTGMIKRKYGPNSHMIFSNISAIWISHPHFDHILGLRELLSEIYKVQTTPITLLSQSSVSDFAKLTNVPFKLVPRDHLFVIDGFTITSFPVDHSFQSMGCIIESNGAKFVYSGDKFANPPIPMEAKQCDLLLHESTYPNVHLFLERYKHSSLLDVENETKRIFPKYVLLTHFSSNFSRNVFSTGLTNIVRNFDFLTFNFESMDSIFPKIYQLNCDLNIKE